MASEARTERQPKGYVVKEGHLPVSEFLFDKAGAGSPFGEDVAFPLPVENLRYEYTEPQPTRDR